jgi:hypothetical protein
MDENAQARAPEEQAAKTRQLSGGNCGHSREDWPDALREPCEPAQDELDFRQSKVAGHRWGGWRRLTGDEGYFAVCSCGWRSTETDYMSPMLRQVKEHLDAVRAVRGWRPSTRAAQAPDRDERERDASQREMRPDERTRELYASVESQQRRLSQVLEDSGDLLAASGDQADRFVAVLEHAAAEITPEWARTSASARDAEVLQRQAERAKELRNGIVAAAGALAAIAGEVALLEQDLETRCLSGSAEYERLAAGPANRHGGREFVAG